MAISIIHTNTPHTLGEVSTNHKITSYSSRIADTAKTCFSMIRIFFNGIGKVFLKKIVFLRGSLSKLLSKISNIFSARIQEKERLSILATPNPLSSSLPQLEPAPVKEDSEPVRTEESHEPIEDKLYEPAPVKEPSETVRIEEALEPIEEELSEPAIIEEATQNTPTNSYATKAAIGTITAALVIGSLAALYPNASKELLENLTQGSSSAFNRAYTAASTLYSRAFTITPNIGSTTASAQSTPPLTFTPPTLPSNPLTAPTINTSIHQAIPHPPLSFTPTNLQSNLPIQAIVNNPPTCVALPRTPNPSSGFCAPLPSTRTNLQAHPLIHITNNAPTCAAPSLPKTTPSALPVHSFPFMPANFQSNLPIQAIVNNPPTCAALPRTPNPSSGFCAPLASTQANLTSQNTSGYPYELANRAVKHPSYCKAPINKGNDPDDSYHYALSIPFIGLIAATLYRITSTKKEQPRPGPQTTSTGTEPDSKVVDESVLIATKRELRQNKRMARKELSAKERELADTQLLLASREKEKETLDKQKQKLKDQLEKSQEEVVRLTREAQKETRTSETQTKDQARTTSSDTQTDPIKRVLTVEDVKESHAMVRTLRESLLGPQIPTQRRRRVSASMQTDRSEQDLELSYLKELLSSRERELAATTEVAIQATNHLSRLGQRFREIQSQGGYVAYPYSED
jgi:hypothetical protein